MDMSMDGSPIIDKTGIEGLYLNAGWCYGGFKATPASGWCFAYTIAREPHDSTPPSSRPVPAGHMIDEKGRAPRRTCTDGATPSHQLPPLRTPAGRGVDRSATQPYPPHL